MILIILILIALSGTLLPLICLTRGLGWSDRENVREKKEKQINSVENTPTKTPLTEEGRFDALFVCSLFMISWSLDCPSNSNVSPSSCHWNFYFCLRKYLNLTRRTSWHQYIFILTVQMSVFVAIFNCLFKQIWYGFLWICTCALHFENNARPNIYFLIKLKGLVF